MNKYVDCINYLAIKNTSKINHSNKSFFQHLINVYNILRNWDCEEDICYAGLFHSIYGNEIFTQKIETDREKIKKLIGEKAEEIVYVFNKDRFYSKETKLIHFANELDNGILIVKDNCYDEKNCSDIYKYFREEVGWRYRGTGIPNSHWTKFRYDLKFKNKNELFLKKLSKDILEELKIAEFLTLKEAYASANPYGTVHESHIDFKNKGGITVMFYLNHYWNIDYGGETVFYNSLETDITNSIIPKPKRMVIFDGTIKHCAREVRRDVPDLRMVLTFKYSLKPQL